HDQSNEMGETPPIRECCDGQLRYRVEKPTNRNAFDDVRVYAELESSLYGALLHVLRVCGQAVSADYAVGHVFGAAAASQDTALDVLHPDVNLSWEHLLHWPRLDHSLFRQAQKARLYDDGFRAAGFLQDEVRDQAFTLNGSNKPLPL